MRVALIGAGINGVTTAYELALDGHEVTVYEQRGSIAAQASFAQAGLMAPGHLQAFAAPSLTGALLNPLLRRPATLERLCSVHPGLLPWLWRWWRANRAPGRLASLRQLHSLVHYSQARLHQLDHDLGLEHEHSQGHLVLLRSKRERQQAEASMAVLHELGERADLLDPAQAQLIEPALQSGDQLIGALHLPGDEVVNGRQFAHRLKDEARRLGVQFHFHHDVLSVVPGTQPLVMAQARDDMLESQPNDELRSNPPSTVLQAEGAQSFDAVILCAGQGAANLLKPLGVRLNTQLVHGYSITAPLHLPEASPDPGPRSALTDERHQVSITRLGHRVRVAGGYDVGGRDKAWRKGSVDTLYRVLEDWFPGAARTSRATEWRGTRVMTPDGLPVLGASGAPGIWLNLAHGQHGWAEACGAARILADQITGRSGAIDVAQLGAHRFR